MDSVKPESHNSRFNHADRSEPDCLEYLMGEIFVQYDLPRPERANNRRVDGWRLCYTRLDTEGLAVLENCPDVIDSIPKLMRDEKNIEDAQKEDHASSCANRFAMA